MSKESESVSSHPRELLHVEGGVSPPPREALYYIGGIGGRTIVGEERDFGAESCFYILHLYLLQMARPGEGTTRP